MCTSSLSEDSRHTLIKTPQEITLHLEDVKILDRDVVGLIAESIIYI